MRVAKGGTVAGSAKVLPLVVGIFALACALLVFVGCGATNNQAPTSQTAATQVSTAQSVMPTTGEVNVVKDTNFNGVMLDMTEEEFAALGFEPGDSVDVVIDGFLTFEDVPFYDGYYARTGEYLLVSYPGEPHPNFRRAQSTLWDDLPITEDSTIVVTLRERGKYKDVEDALSMMYSNIAEDFSADEVFANFRVMSGGNLKDNLVYRSASPIDNTYLRAAVVNGLIQVVGVKYALNLSDNESEFEAASSENGAACQYYRDLKDAGNVALLDLSNSYSSTAFKQTLATAIYEMCQHEGPYLVHCVEGKDRTGFVCMLIGALTGASVDEIIDDYMITYDNYYGINKETSQAKYDAIVEAKAYDLLQTVSGESDPSKITAASLQADAEKYLKDGGLTDEQVSQVKATLCK